MFVPESRIREFCRFYSDDATVRRNLAFELGIYVPLSRIAKVRKKLGRLKAAHLGHDTTSGYMGGENPKLHIDMMTRGSQALLKALVREHPGAFRK